MYQASAEIFLALSLYFIPYTSLVFIHVYLFKKDPPLILLLSSDISHCSNSPLLTKLASTESCAPKVRFCLSAIGRSPYAGHFMEASQTSDTEKYYLLAFADRFVLCSEHTRGGSIKNIQHWSSGGK